MTATPKDRLTAVNELPKTVDIETSKGVLVMPHPVHVPAGVLRKGRKLTDPVEQIFLIIEETFEEGSEQMALVDSLSTLELGQVMATWQQGAALGESSGSES